MTALSGEKLKPVNTKKLANFGSINPEVTEIRSITAEEMLEIRVKRGDFRGPQGIPGPAGESIRGEIGPVGPAGELGKQGFRGVKGDSIQGPRGADGRPGTAGRDGRDGINGKSAFEIWRSRGNRGSEAEFIAALAVQGVAGPPGPTTVGKPGPAGPAGPMPKHEWKQTSLRFQNPDLSWGPWVDLSGAIYLGYNPNPDPNILGYVFVQDAAYTSTNAFFIAANTRVAITIDGKGALTSYTNGPPEANTWWQTDTFVPTKQGEYYDLRVNLQMSPVANAQAFTAELDIGTPNTIWSQTGGFSKQAAEPAKYSFPIPLTVGPTFIKNGAKFYIKPTCDVWIFGMSILIKREYHL